MSGEIEFINTNDFLKDFTLNLNIPIKDINDSSNRKINKSSVRGKSLIVIFKQRERIINCFLRDFGIRGGKWTPFNKGFSTLRTDISSLMADNSKRLFKKNRVFYFLSLWPWTFLEKVWHTGQKFPLETRVIKKKFWLFLKTNQTFQR